MHLNSMQSLQGRASGVNRANVVVIGLHADSEDGDEVLDFLGTQKDNLTVL